MTNDSQIAHAIEDYVPQRYRRLMTTSVADDGLEAIVVLRNPSDTNDLYEAVFFRDDDGWTSGHGMSGVSFGWRPRRQDANGQWLGVVRLWERVPPNVAQVVVSWIGRDEVIDPVDGWLLFIRWDVPADFMDRPVVRTYMRTDGSVVTVPRDKAVDELWEEATAIASRVSSRRHRGA